MMSLRSVTITGMMVMYGGLAGSFWWVMLTFTVFQFIVIKFSSVGAKKFVRTACLLGAAVRVMVKLTPWALEAPHFIARGRLGHACGFRDHSVRCTAIRWPGRRPQLLRVSPVGLGHLLRTWYLPDTHA
jgi:hypothetical protein